MSAITAHCLVKNEESFVGYAIESVIDFVDKIMVFDTGSADKTIEIIQGLVKKYPNKIIFEEKGVCDKARHTELRNEMIKKTMTDWFMILDGDEVWTRRGMGEAMAIIKNQPAIECIVTPFYLCVGDIFHRYYKKGGIELLGKKDFFYPRFFKITNNIRWSGDYNKDTLVDNSGNVFFNQNNSVIMAARYWHLTHLRRSSRDDLDYSSGGSRKVKRRLTYFIIGKKINELIPEVFHNNYDFKLNTIMSFVNFVALIFSRIIN